MAQTPKSSSAHSPKSLSDSQSLDCTPSFDDGSMTPSAEHRLLRTRTLSTVSATSCSFQEDTTCKVCGAALGKRKLNPRHHCRICGASVCAKCSPSQVQVEGEKALVRACAPCVINVEKAKPLTERLSNLGKALNGLGDSKPFEELPATLEEAVGRCEEMVPAIEDLSESHATKTSQLAGARLQLEDITGRAERTEAQLVEVQKAHDSLASALKDTRDSLATTTTQLAESQITCKSAEHRAVEAEVEAKELKSEQSQLESSLKEERYLHATVRAELQEARFKHEAAETRVGVAESEMETLQQSLQQLESALEEERGSHAIVRAELEETRSKHELAENLVEVAESKVETLQKSYQQLESTLEDERSSHAVVRAELDEAKSNHELAKSLVGVAESKVETLRKSQQQLESTLEGERKSKVVVNSEVQEIKSKHEATENRAYMAEVQVDALQQTLKHLEATMKERADHEDAKSKLADSKQSEVDDTARRQAEDRDGELSELKARVTSIEGDFKNEKQLREFAEQKLQALERNQIQNRSDDSSLPSASSDLPTALADRRNDEVVPQQRCSERGCHRGGHGGCVSM